MEETQSGKLFTNGEHSIIYISPQVRAILEADSAWFRNTIGKPIYPLFGINLNQYEDFLNSYINIESPEEVSLEFHMPDNRKVVAKAIGHVKKSPENKLVGVDYIIMKTSGFSLPVNTQIDNTQAQQLLDAYMKEQIDGLFEIALNWGGSQFGDYLNNLVNQTAQEYDWDVEMKSGRIVLHNAKLDLNIQVALMVKVASYTGSMLGKNIVVKQVETVNKQTDEFVFQYIDQDWYKVI